MEEKAKKPSLFKQRIAGLKKNHDEKGFPQVVDLIGQQLSNPVEVSKEMTAQEGQVKVQAKGLIELIKGQTVLKEEDMKKIQSENWSKVEAMSEEQRQSMVKLINHEMKESFITRIKKEVPPPKENLNKPLPKIEEKPEASQQKQEDNESWEQLLKVNIETDRLEYTEQEGEHLVGVSRIMEMIGSDNNQSQIIGSKIAGKLVYHLISQATHKSRELVIVNHVPLHLSLIFQRCSYLLFEPMIRKAKSTTFKSAFIEIATAAAEILTKIKKYVSNECRLSILKPLKALLEKSNSFRIEKESVVAIQSSLELLCTLYSEHENKVEDQNWEDLIANSDIILELVLIEQAEVTFHNTYALNIFQFVEKSTDLMEITSVERFVYELINKLLLRRNKQLYINIESFRNLWRPIIDSIVIRFIPKVANSSLETIFQLIFLARFAGGNAWEAIIQTLPHLSQLKPMIPHFLLFNTLSDQKSQGLREENLESLNAIINWLANCLSSTPCKLNPSYVLNTLMELFLQEQQYYSSLDQPILQKLITSIAIRKQTNFGLIFTEERVRTLIKNYSFNSFGSEVFTNLLLFASIKSSPDLEAMILREVIARYINNFADAAKALEIPFSSLSWKSNSANKQIKIEILEQMNPHLRQEQNILIAYLNA